MRRLGDSPIKDFWLLLHRLAKVTRSAERKKVGNTKRLNGTK
jgi:hypothetical protein